MGTILSSQSLKPGLAAFGHTQHSASAELGPAAGVLCGVESPALIPMLPMASLLSWDSHDINVRLSDIIP